jgi:hypothetical protein
MKSMQQDNDIIDMIKSLNTMKMICNNSNATLYTHDMLSILKQKFLLKSRIDYVLRQYLSNAVEK